MLVLSRRAEESVVIGGTNVLKPMLTVTVLGIEHGRVRLGFESDRDLPIHRQEVWQKIHGVGAE